MPEVWQSKAIPGLAISSQEVMADSTQVHPGRRVEKGTKGDGHCHHPCRPLRNANVTSSNQRNGGTPEGVRNRHRPTMPTGIKLL